MKNKSTKPIFNAFIYAFLLLFATVNTYANKNLDTPVLHPADFVMVNDFKATWDAVDGATYYKLWVTDTPGLGLFPPLYNGKIITTNEEWVVNLDFGHEYEYWIKAYDDDGNESGFSNTILVTTNTPNVDPPALPAATNITGNGFHLSWTAVEGNKVGYQLLISKDNFETLEPFYDFPYRFTTTHTVTSLDPLTEYKFKVKAKDFDGENESTFSLTQTAQTLLPPPVALEATDIGHDRFTANWSSVTNTTGYRLWVLDSNYDPVDGFYPIVVNDTKKTVTGLDPETNYTYTVQSVADDLSSSSSNVIEVTTTQDNSPNPPVALEATHPSSAWFLINWEEVDDVDHYKIYISTDNFSSHVEDYAGRVAYGDHFPFDNLNFLFDEANPETDYQYRLTSVADGYESTFSNTINVSTTSVPDIPQVPLALSAEKVTDQSFVARWEEAEDGIFYRVYVSDDGFETYLDGYGGKPVWWEFTLKVEGLEPGKTYEYRVKASNESGRSDYSNIINVTTLYTEVPDDPVALDANDITQTGFTANWEAVDYSDGYLLFVSDDDFAAHLDGYDGKDIGGLSEVITGLDPETTYKYRLKAYNENGESEFSNTIEVTTDDTGTFVNGIAESSISIYPNPAQNHFYIEGLEKNSTIDIFSGTGAKMMRLENQSGRVNLDVSGLNNGIYIIKINTVKGVVSRKILINK